VSRRWALLLGWLGIQILTLGVGAMRLPLSARAGSEPQNLALPEMVVVQLALATLLFPVLLGEGVGFMTAASALPFLQLAGFLTATPIARVCTLGLAIMLWFAGLWAWRVALANEQIQLIGVAVLGTLAIGAPIGGYLVREFSDSESGSSPIPRILDPLTSLLSGSTASAIDSATAFAPAGILLLSGAIALGLRRKSFSRQVIHKLFHSPVVRESGKLTQ